MNIAGIDPGKTGALALIVDDELADVTDTPAIDKRVNAAAVSDWFSTHKQMHGIDLVVIENVHSRPGQGVSSSFNFGRALGCVEGVVLALGLPVSFVTPATWKRDMGLTGKDKGASRQLATDTWPTWAGSFQRVKDDGRAEAALLALWGLRAAS